MVRFVAMVVLAVALGVGGILGGNAMVHHGWATMMTFEAEAHPGMTSDEVDLTLENMRDKWVNGGVIIALGSPILGLVLVGLGIWRLIRERRRQAALRAMDNRPFDPRFRPLPEPREFEPAVLAAVGHEADPTPPMRVIIGR